MYGDTGEENRYFLLVGRRHTVCKMGLITHIRGVHTASSIDKLESVIEILPDITYRKMMNEYLLYKTADCSAASTTTGSF